MGHRGRDLIVVGLTTTSGELYLIQHYVIKFVSDLRQVSGVLDTIPRYENVKPRETSD
jgi:hypothetical protein